MMDIAECCKEINEIGVQYVEAQEQLRRRHEEHAKTLTIIDKECRTRIQELTNGKNKAITQAKSGRNARNAALDAMSNRVGELRELANEASIGRETDVLTAQGMNCDTLDDGFDWQSLEDMARRITDTSVIARVKGVFHSGGYAPKEQMVSDFERSLDSAEQYVIEQRDMAQSTARDVEISMSEMLKAETEEANNEKKRRTEEENTSFNSEVAKLQAVIDACLDGSAFGNVSARIADAYEAVSGTQAGLACATFPAEAKTEVYLGSLTADVDLSEDLRAPLQKEFNSFCKYPMIRAPYAVDFNRTPMMVLEVSSCHRSRALSGIMSLVARKLVSAPYGKTAITVVDPLGGGTSLGNFQRFAEDLAFPPLCPTLGDQQAIEEGLDRALNVICSDNVGTRPESLFVILDYPCNVTDAERESLEKLLQASTEGMLSTIVLKRKGFGPPSDGERIEAMLNACPLKVVEQGDSFVIEDGGITRPIVLAVAEEIQQAYFQTLGNYKEETRPVRIEGEIGA